MIPVSQEKRDSFISYKRIPIGKVEIFNTPYTVPSRGFRIEFFQGGSIEGGTTGNMKYAGNDSQIMHDWGEGVPEVINDFPYQVKWYGYFYARFSGVYKFYAYSPSTSRTCIYFADSNTKPESLTGGSLLVDKLQNTTMSASEDTSYLTAGTWYPIRVEFWNAGTPAYIVVLYREPDGAVDSDGQYSDFDSTGDYHYGNITEEHKVLSAGVVNFDETWSNRTEAEFLQPVRLPILGLRGNKKLNEISEYSFEVGIDQEDVDDTYFYDSNNDVIQYTSDDSITIKKNRLVRIYTGYELGCSNFSGGTCQSVHGSGWQITALCSNLGNPDCPYNTPSSGDYTKVFTGVITSFEFDRKSIDNSATITCKDAGFLLLNTLDENYPDTSSYMAAEYTEFETDGGAGPNGISKPQAYDGWTLAKAIRDLCLHAGIDATLLYGKQASLTTDYSEYFGNFLVGGGDIRLRKNYYYGITDYVYPVAYTVGEPEAPTAEEKYNFAGNFGDKLYDRVSNFAELFGFLFGVSNDGNIFFKSINTPEQYGCTDTGGIYGFTDLIGFSKTTDIRAINGGLFESTEDGDSATCRAFGSKFDVIISCDSDSFAGAGSTGIFEDCIDDVVQGGYPACSPGFEAKLLKLDQDPQGSLVTDSYIAFKAKESFTLSEIQLNISRVISYGYTVMPRDFYYWEFDIDLADLGGYPTGYNDFATATYSTNLASGISVSGLDTQGLAVLTTSGTNLTAGNYYALRFKTSNPGATPHSRAGGAIYISAVRGGDKFPLANDLRDITISSGEFHEDNLWCDIELLSASTLESITITATRVSDSTVVFEGGASSYFSEDWYYYDGLNPSLGRNPAVFTINAQDLASQNDYRSYLAADVYDITVTNNTNSIVKLEGVFAFKEDIGARVWAFSTANSSDLKCKLSPEDIRNDVFIVGSLRGPIRNLDGKIVNPNNPTLEYFYSRAVDLNSKYGLDYKNSVGSKRQFILQLPNVATDEHANWIAVGTLQRFREEGKEVSILTDGINILECGDCIGIQDVANRTIEIGTNLWVNELSEEITSDSEYTSSISAASIEPWESYMPKKEPDINMYLDTGGNPQAFVQVSITTTRATETGFTNESNYDCYESESQNYVSIEYYQVLNGNVRIYICMSGQNQPIAILTPPQKGGVDSSDHAYQDWGRHEILWDGIAWHDSARPIAKNTGYYVEDGSFYVCFELVKDNTPYRVSSANLPTENNLNENAECYITTALSLYPTAGSLIITPTGCGHSHYAGQDVLPLCAEGFKVIGAPLPDDATSFMYAYWSRPNQISCADFDSNDVSYSFSVSGYNSARGFTNRWISGTIKMYCVEKINPNGFYEQEEWGYGYAYGAGGAIGDKRGVGGLEKISKDYTQDLSGFYTTDRPATMNINPKNMLGIHSNTYLSYDRIEMEKDFTIMDGELDFGGGGSYTWDFNEDRLMYYKAIVIDCSQLRDRAGKMIWQQFEYGYGPGQNTATTDIFTGYRLCRFDRLHGFNRYIFDMVAYDPDEQPSEPEYFYGETLDAGCAFYFYHRYEDNPWGRAQYNPRNAVDVLVPPKPDALFRTTCIHSKILNNDPDLHHEDDWSGEDRDSCKKCDYYLCTQSGRKINFIDEITSRYALNHVIFWHPEGYTQVPFCWSSNKPPDEFYEIPWRSSSRFYSLYSNKNLKSNEDGGASVLSSDFYNAIIAVDPTELKENESGQKIMVG
jgi:hypothetical protein